MKQKQNSLDSINLTDRYELIKKKFKENNIQSVFIRYFKLFSGVAQETGSRTRDGKWFKTASVIV